MTRFALAVSWLALAAASSSATASDEPLSELAAHMLAAFLAGDRAFAKERDALNQRGRSNV